jgi:outer membrane protein/protease secretion system outer membrane protein
MTHKNVAHTAWWLCALLAAAPAAALDLVQAYELARQQDTELRAARAARDVGMERVPQAQAQLRPKITIGINQSFNNLQRSVGGSPLVADANQGYQQSLQLRQSVYSKPLRLGLLQAQQEERNAEAVLQAEEQALVVRLAQAYFQILLSQDSLTLLLKQQALYEAQADAARKSLAAGAGTRTDIDEAVVRLDLSKSDELDIRQQAAVANTQLAILLGRPPVGLSALRAEPLVPQAPDTRALEEWVKLAQDHSPELRAIQAQVEAARLGVERAQAAGQPTLDAVLQWTRSGGENLNSPNSRYVNKGVSLQLNMPLYTSGLIDSTVRQALAEWTRLQETEEVVRRDIALQVTRQHGGVTVGLRKVQAMQQAEQSALQLVASSRRSLQAGSRTVLDVLDAEQRLQDTRRQLAQARYSYLLAKLQLDVLAGQSQEIALQDINHWLRPASAPLFTND